MRRSGVLNGQVNLDGPGRRTISEGAEGTKIDNSHLAFGSVLPFSGDCFDLWLLGREVYRVTDDC